MGVEADQGVVEVRGELSPGSTAFLVQHLGGAWMEHLRFGEQVASATVSEQGDVRFEGLPVAQRFWLCGEAPQGPRNSQVTAKLQSSAGPFDGLGAPRGTFESVPREVGERPESVGPRQQDVPADVLQRSDTPVGAATVIPSGERSPKPATGDVEGGLRASDTPEGELEAATERARQDDVPDDVLQRSSTPAGVATPIPPAAEPARVGDVVHDPAAVLAPDDVVALTGHPGEEVQEGADIAAVPVQDSSGEGGSRISATPEEREAANADAGLAGGLATGFEQPELKQALADEEAARQRLEDDGAPPAPDEEAASAAKVAAQPDPPDDVAPPATPSSPELADPREDPATDTTAERTPREEVAGDVVQVGSSEQATSADVPSDAAGTVPPSTPKP
jgi:hypothetical protein